MSEALLAPAGCRGDLGHDSKTFQAVRSRARSRRRVWRATRHRTFAATREEWRAPPDHRAGAHHGFDRGAHRVPILARRLERVGARFIARPARSVAARVKRGTWNVPDDEVPSDERVGGGGDAVALDLDAEEPEPDPIPPALGSFAPGRDDGMARMPVPDIALESPGRWSPISFAFLGDAVWELYVRRAFFAPPAQSLDYDLKCKRAVRAEAQASSSDISSNEASSQVRARTRTRTQTATPTNLETDAPADPSHVHDPQRKRREWCDGVATRATATSRRVCAGREKVATRYTVTRRRSSAWLGGCT